MDLFHHAVELCRRLARGMDFIGHATGGHEFEDEFYFYRFKSNRPLV
jgi:hypothetical protein